MVSAKWELYPLDIFFKLFVKVEFSFQSVYSKSRLESVFLKMVKWGRQMQEKNLYCLSFYRKKFYLKV